jgi:hypothetical protein
MGRAYGKHDRGGKCVQNFYLKCLMEISHLPDLDVDGKILLKWILKRSNEVCTVCVRLMTGTKCTSGYLKILG